MSPKAHAECTVCGETWEGPLEEVSEAVDEHNRFHEVDIERVATDGGTDADACPNCRVGVDDEDCPHLRAGDDCPICTAPLEKPTAEKVQCPHCNYVVNGINMGHVLRDFDLTFRQSTRVLDLFGYDKPATPGSAGNKLRRLCADHDIEREAFNDILADLRHVGRYASDTDDQPVATDGGVAKLYYAGGNAGTSRHLHIDEGCRHLKQTSNVNHCSPGNAPRGQLCNECADDLTLADLREQVVTDGGQDIPEECISCGATPVPAGDDCWECPDCGLTGCGIGGCTHDESSSVATDGGHPPGVSGGATHPTPDREGYAREEKGEE